jgi:hypothetical protein
MRAVWMRARAELRSRWRATVVLMLLVGLAAGVVMSAALGARRTQTAFPRFLKTAHAADALISVPLSGIRSFYPEVARLPEVERAGVGGGVNVFYVHPSGAADIRITGIASVDGRVGWTVDRPNVLSGRLPRRDRPFEIAVNRFLAHQLHLAVGDKLPMRAFPAGEEGMVDPQHVPPSAGLRQTFTVVGITVTASEVLPLAEQDAAPTFLLTPAYFDRYADPRHLQFDGAFIRLMPGADIGRRSAGGSPQV